MNFYVQKKEEYEALLAEAWRAKDYKKACDHCYAAAQCTLNLAKLTDGLTQQAYLNHVKFLMDCLNRLKAKCAATKPAAMTTEATGASGVKSSDKKEESNVDAKRWIIDKPQIHLTDVAGMQEVKDALEKNIINAIANPEIFKKFGVKAGLGLLLYGPPGTGKTFVAKAIAGDLDAVFFAVTPGEIKSKYVGESESNLRALFEEARKHPRAVIFFDEVDELLKMRSPEDRGSVVAEFLQQADGMKENKNTLILMGATNNPWQVDPAVARPGRLGKRIYVGLPDEPARKKIFELNLKKVELLNIDLDDFAKRTEGFSGADIKAICETAKTNAIDRCIADPKSPQALMYEELDQALKSTKKSVSPELEERYHEWNREMQSLAGE
ncbi:MAG: ATP-binding protein [Planctomycetia bacterium]|nr:ATP-binding protein [Planctomycetia bacterium]